MPRTAQLFTLLALLGLLAGCGTGGPTKRVWPPQASLHELAIEEDGTWRLGLRLKNFSTVAMTFERAELELILGGEPAGRIEAMPAMRIGPGSVEIITLQLPPDFEAAGLAVDALQTGSGVRYSLQGRIHTSDPSGSHRTDFESVLTPVPGLQGVLR